MATAIVLWVIVYFLCDLGEYKGIFETEFIVYRPPQTKV